MSKTREDSPVVDDVPMSPNSRRKAEFNLRHLPGDVLWRARSTFTSIGDVLRPRANTTVENVKKDNATERNSLDIFSWSKYRRKTVDPSKRDKSDKKTTDGKSNNHNSKDTDPKHGTKKSTKKYSRTNSVDLDLIDRHNVGYLSLSYDDKLDDIGKSPTIVDDLQKSRRSVKTSTTSPPPFKSSTHQKSSSQSQQNNKNHTKDNRNSSSAGGDTSTIDRRNNRRNSDIFSTTSSTSTTTASDESTVINARLKLTKFVAADDTVINVRPKQRPRERSCDPIYERARPHSMTPILEQYSTDERKGTKMTKKLSFREPETTPQQLQQQQQLQQHHQSILNHHKMNSKAKPDYDLSNNLEVDNFFLLLYFVFLDVY